MRIGEVARRAGVNVETLRYYERRGLLDEPPRSPNGHRAYDEETVRFVRAVKEAQSLGFTLEEIAEHTRLTRRGHAEESIRIRLAQKVDEVDAKIASLRRVRDELARVLGCACDSLDRCTCGAAYLARGGRDPELGPLLHVTNGESAGNTLRQTGIGGAVLSWQDVLHEGPVPAVPPAELRRIRARFLSECGWGTERALLDSLERRDRLLTRSLASGRHVVLWFEPDLYDQLQLLQILALAAESERTGRLELLQADDFLGPLAAEELERLWPERRELTRETLELGRRAWAAFRAPEPTAVEAVLARDTSPLPFLAAALRRLLEELPDVTSGLSRTERQLLEPLRDGPRTPGELFVESQAREEAAFAGDTWVWRTLTGLGPLVSAESGAALPLPPPVGELRAFARTRVALTGEGREVLAGKADRLAFDRPDRWLGGTNLGDGPDWRWDAAAGRVSAAS